MSKRALITNIAPLPQHISRETAVAYLHDHVEMIELNPLVLRHERTTAPSNAAPDERENMVWYQITDEIQYIPGTPLKGEVSYKAGFYNLPTGLQTHTFAPAGVDIQGKWTIGGNGPGEKKETPELWLDKPKDGLYIREDVDLKCSIFLLSFVKKNMKKSHDVLVNALIEKAGQQEDRSAPKTSEELRPPSLAGLGISHGNAVETTSAPQLRRRSSQPSSSPPPSLPYTMRAASWEPTPTQSYAQTELGICFCTSLEHAEGCPHHPNRKSSQSSSSRPPRTHTSHPLSFSRPRPSASAPMTRTERHPEHD